MTPDFVRPRSVPHRGQHINLSPHVPKTIIEQVALICRPGAEGRLGKGLAGALSPQRQRKHAVVLRFRRRREHPKEPEQEPQLPTPEPEDEPAAPDNLQSAEDSDSAEPAEAEAGEAPVASEELPSAESDTAGPADVAVISGDLPLVESESAEPANIPAVSDELPLTESAEAAIGQEPPTGEAAEEATPTSYSPGRTNSESLSLLNTLLRLHGAEDIESLLSAADQLVRCYLNGTHLLVLLVDKAGSFYLRTGKSNVTRALLEQLTEALGIDVSRESPPPRRGRMAKIWLDDTASAQAISLADLWGTLAGEETCWRAEKAAGISQVTAIRLASPEEPMGIALFVSQGDPPDLAMLDAIGRHLTVALASLLTLEKARQFGSIDPVRWIPNHSEFGRQLSRELSRSRRYGQPVSIALLVIDNFDVLRLEYGWTVANRLLRSVSSTLAGCLRESDFLGSYRHNGFGAILMQTPEETASEAADRLRDAAAGIRVLEGDDSPVPECVVATASCPKDADEAGALLVAAESRLLPKRRLSSASA